MFKLRGNGKWCHALVTHPSSGTVIQKPEAIGLLPLLSRSGRVTDSDVPRGHVVYLSGWWMQVWIRVADAELESLEEGRRNQTLQVYADTWAQRCQIFREPLVAGFCFCGRGGHTGFWAWNGWMERPLWFGNMFAVCSQSRGGGGGGLVPFWIYKVIVVLWRTCYWATFHKLDFYLLLRHAIITIFPHVCV